MTPKAKRQALIAGGVIVVFAGVVYTTRQGDAPVAAAVAPAAASTAGQAGRDVPVVDVQLELLNGVQVEAGEPQRNPFRFQPKAPPPAPPRPAAAARPATPATPIVTGPRCCLTRSAAAPPTCR